MTSGIAVDPRFINSYRLIGWTRDQIYLNMPGTKGKYFLKGLWCAKVHQLKKRRQKQEEINCQMLSFISTIFYPESFQLLLVLAFVRHGKFLPRLVKLALLCNDIGASCVSRNNLKSFPWTWERNLGNLRKWWKILALRYKSPVYC